MSLSSIPSIPRIVVSISVFVFSVYAAKSYRDELMRKWTLNTNNENMNITKNLLYYYLFNILYYCIIATGISISLYILQVMPTISITIFAVSAAISYIILNNIITLYTPGILIILKSFFSIGQRLTIRRDLNTVIASGIVQDFNLTNTVIKRDDGRLSIIPNSIIMTNIIDTV